MYVLGGECAKVKRLQALEPKTPFIVPHENMLNLITRDPFLFPLRLLRIIFTRINFRLYTGL